MKKGFFIDFEGGEFTGKTTQHERAEEYLESKGFSVVATHEPGGGDPQIREKLLNAKGKISPEEELDLFCKDRRLHIQQVIQPALEEGKIVLCDRFAPSTIAYQGYGRGLPMDLVKKKIEETCQGVWPDLIIFLSAGPSIAMTRAPASKQYDRFEKEKLAFHRRVWIGFLVQAAEDKKRWRIINATLSKDEVWDQVRQCIDQLIAERGAVPSNA